VDALRLALPTRIDVERCCSTLAQIAQAHRNWDPDAGSWPGELDVDVARIIEDTLPHCIEAESEPSPERVAALLTGLRRLAAE
jgi:hypothetical protein